MSEGRKLTIKQERFCDKYIECGNASEAYRFAFSCGNMKLETIHRKAKELLDYGKITARVTELRKEIAIKSEITKERILAEYAKIAFSSIANLHNTWMDRVAFESLTDDQKASVESIDTRIQRRVVDDEVIQVEQIKVKLYSKLSALDSIAKMLGYNEPQKLEVTGKDGERLIAPHFEISKLTPEQRAVLLTIGQDILNEPKG